MVTLLLKLSNPKSLNFRWVRGFHCHEKLVCVLAVFSPFRHGILVIFRSIVCVHFFYYYFCCFVLIIIRRFILLIRFFAWNKRTCVFRITRSLKIHSPPLFHSLRLLSQPLLRSSFIFFSYPTPASHLLNRVCFFFCFA